MRQNTEIYDKIVISRFPQLSFSPLPGDNI